MQVRSSVSWVSSAGSLERADGVFRMQPQGLTRMVMSMKDELCR